MPIGRRIAHERAVALVGLDDEQVGAAGERVAGQALRLQQGQIAAGDDRGIRPAPRRISKIMAVTVDLPLVPLTAT